MLGAFPGVLAGLGRSGRVVENISTYGILVPLRLRSAELWHKTLQGWRFPSPGGVWVRKDQKT